MSRQSATERQRALDEAVRRARLHPEQSLTPEQRTEVTRELLARGWHVAKKRPRPTVPECWDCGASVPETENILDRLCDDCRKKRVPL